MEKYVDNVYIINMEKDTERLNNMIKKCKKLDINFEKMTGIDINKLSKKEKNENINNIFQLYATKSAIGCSLTHKKIYKDIINKKYKNALILEDDIYFTDDFYKVLENVYNDVPKDYDIIFLGCGGLCNDKTYNDINIFLKIFTIFNKKKEINKEHIFIPEFPLTTHGYIISYNGCHKILKN